MTLHRRVGAAKATTLISTTKLFILQMSKASLWVQQLIDVCILDNSSLGVVSHQLHQSWKPQLQHLVATIAALDFDVCLHHSLGFAEQLLTLTLGR